MNRLFAFGCSFTDWNYQIHHSNAYNNVNEHNKIHNFTKQDHFIHKLSVELGLECINRGQGGASNAYILKTFYQSLPEFKKGDVILLQSTFGNRLTFHHRDTNEQMDLVGPMEEQGNPMINEKRYGSNFIKTINDYLVLYNHPEFTIDTMYEPYPMISEWCKMKGIHIVFWNLDDYNPLGKLVENAPNGSGWCNWISENGLTIGDECGNGDSHLGLIGMDIMFEKFILIIKDVIARDLTNN